jgi:hypothetical protein
MSKREVYMNPALVELVGLYSFLSIRRKEDSSFVLNDMFYRTRDAIRRAIRRTKR